MQGSGDQGDGRDGEMTVTSLRQPLGEGAPGWHIKLSPSRRALAEPPRHHGPVAVRDVFVNWSEGQLKVSAAIDNDARVPMVVDVIVHSVGLARRGALTLDPGYRGEFDVSLGHTGALHWSPEQPVLHELAVDAWVGASLSDRRRIRYGLRTIRVAEGRLHIDGSAYRLRGADVHTDEHGTESTKAKYEHFRAEVEGAKALGLNTLRVCRPFDPEYLDVCDEVGMFVVVDLGVSMHGNDTGYFGAGNPTEWQTAIVDQLCRDRNHPSVLLWRVENNLISHSVLDAIKAADPTRPYVWLSGSSSRGQAPWVGLHDQWETSRRRSEPTCCRNSKGVAGNLAATPWPASEAEFLRGAERSHSLAERLRIERLRQRDDIGSSWLPRLVETPGGLNGPLDSQRRPKPAALVELGRANQTVMPMAAFASFVFRTGRRQLARLSISNDGPVLHDAVLDVCLGAWTARLDLGVIPEGLQFIGKLSVRAPRTPGGHEFVLRLSSHRGLISENRYPVHVVAPRPARHAVWVIGATKMAGLLAKVGATVYRGSAGGHDHLAEWSPRMGPVLVAEDALNTGTGAVLRTVLAEGGTAVVLAQAHKAAPHYPLSVVLEPTGGCDSRLLRFTTDHHALSSLPRRRVLTVEDGSMTPTAIFTRLGIGSWASATVVGAWAPSPRLAMGTVVGAHPVGPGRLIVCQLRLADGGIAAVCLLSELIRWAVAPGALMAREPVTLADGRSMIFYSFGNPVDRE
jgi:hypothetical protein